MKPWFWWWFLALLPWLLAFVLWLILELAGCPYSGFAGSAPVACAKASAQINASLTNWMFDSAMVGIGWFTVVSMVCWLRSIAEPPDAD